MSVILRNLHFTYLTGFSLIFETHHLSKSDFRHPSPSVLIPALRTVGNIVTGDDFQTQV